MVLYTIFLKTYFKDFVLPRIYLVTNYNYLFSFLAIVTLHILI